MLSVDAGYACTSVGLASTAGSTVTVNVNSSKGSVNAAAALNVYSTGAAPQAALLPSYVIALSLARVAGTVTPESTAEPPLPLVRRGIGVEPSDDSSRSSFSSNRAKTTVPEHSVLVKRGRFAEALVLSPS